MQIIWKFHAGRPSLAALLNHTDTGLDHSDERITERLAGGRRIDVQHGRLRIETIVSLPVTAVIRPTHRSCQRPLQHTAQEIQIGVTLLIRDRLRKSRLTFLYSSEICSNLQHTAALLGAFGGARAAMLRARYLGLRWRHSLLPGRLQDRIQPCHRNMRHTQTQPTDVAAW